MFGDNKSAVDSLVILHACMQKRHNNLSFHKVREQIAAKTLAFIFLPGHLNPANLLSKHWGCCNTWDLLKNLCYLILKGRNKRTQHCNVHEDTMHVQFCAFSTRNKNVSKVSMLATCSTTCTHAHMKNFHIKDAMLEDVQHAH